MISSIVHSILEGLWSSFLAQWGLAGVVLLACGAIFYFVPFAKARELAIFVAVLDLIFLIGAPKLYMEGVHHERTIWEDREKVRVEAAEKARRDAEAEVPQVVPQGPPEPVPTVESSGGRGFLRRVLPARPGRVRNAPVRHDRYER